ncbi:MAG: chemotaxis protein CheW [Candidatus Aureabacteria bacterium]|nr:chemotaxis protein CheW [Candidatus Auribacterota bacterium]
MTDNINLDNNSSSEDDNRVKQVMDLVEELFVLEGKQDATTESLYQEERKEEETFQCINFLVDKEWYGIEITKVKEIIKVPAITYLPSTPTFISGICNLRGNILTIINTKKIFGLGDCPVTSESRVVVVDSRRIIIGFLVDAVSEVVEIPKSAIDDPLVTLEGEKGEYIVGETKLDDKLVAILDIDKLIQTQCILSSEF